MYKAAVCLHPFHSFCKCFSQAFYYLFDFRYDESRKSTFNFSDEDLSGYVCSDDFERARLLLNAVAQTLVCTEKPNLGDNFFEIGGDSINMVQVCMYLHRWALKS